MPWLPGGRESRSGSALTRSGRDLALPAVHHPRMANLRGEIPAPVRDGDVLASVSVPDPRHGPGATATPLPCCFWSRGRLPWQQFHHLHLLSLQEVCCAESLLADSRSHGTRTGRAGRVAGRVRVRPPAGFRRFMIWNLSAVALAVTADVTSGGRRRSRAWIRYQGLQG